MAGVRMEGDIRRLSKTLRNLGEVPFKQVNRTMGEALRGSTVERFKTGKDPEGKSWKPSRRFYISKNSKVKQSRKKTLVNRGILRNSIKSEPNEKGVAVGTNSIYGATHQLGSTHTIRAKNAKSLAFLTPEGIRRKKVVKVTIPARPFLGVSDEDMGEIKGILQDKVKELIK